MDYTYFVTSQELYLFILFMGHEVTTFWEHRLYLRTFVKSY